MTFDIYSDHNGAPGICLPTSIDITDVLQNIELRDITTGNTYPLSSQSTVG